MKVVQVFTVPISLCFFENQSFFWNTNHCDLTLISSEDRGILQCFGQKNKVHTFIVPFNRGKDPINALSNLISLYFYFRTHRPDIVHGNTPKAAFLSMIAAWLARVPVRVYEMHGLPLETAAWPWKVGYWAVEWLTCFLANHVIAVSPSLRQSALRHKVVLHEKIAVIHHGSCNGIDSTNFFNPDLLDKNKLLCLKQQWHINPDQPVIGFVGRLTSEKGLRELYEAWQLIKPYAPSAQLLVVGDNDQRSPLSSQLIAKLDQDSSIIRIGHQTDIKHIYALLDFLVLPSYREGLGNVVLEAAAMGKPSIVSRVTGLKDAIEENHTGLFCHPKSSHDLAAQLLVYLKNPGLVKRHGQAAQLQVRQKFTPTTIWQAKLILYQRLIATAESVTLSHVPPIFQTTD